MQLDDIKSMVADLLDVEPRSFGTDREASEAAQWIDLQKKTEAEADSVLDPAIKEAFAAHKKLTGQKKTMLEKLLAAKDRVRMHLANWIGSGHEVEGCYVKTKYRVTITDVGLLPSEYLMTVADMPALEEWVKTTEGKMPVPGCTIEPVHVLYAREV